nr:hypothetical protein CFP56_11103 [Quercus suber]
MCRNEPAESRQLATITGSADGGLRTQCCRLNEAKAGDDSSAARNVRVDRIRVDAIGGRRVTPPEGPDSSELGLPGADLIPVLRGAVLLFVERQQRHLAPAPPAPAAIAVLVSTDGGSAGIVLFILNTFIVVNQPINSTFSTVYQRSTRGSRTMLPPQLRSGLASSNTRSVFGTSSVAQHPIGTLSVQSRSFWGWRRGCDWSSQLDPTYQRSHHVRSLKTRAKLRAILRRRGKFEWDVLQKPFFTAKHIRWASHWNGPGSKSHWPQQIYDDKTQDKRDEVKPTKDQNYELSHGEKKWKDLMGSMRRRIDENPYEAVFGKRFEPFWAPLVPSWMKEDMIKQDLKSSAQKAQPSNAEEAARLPRRDSSTEQPTGSGALNGASSRSAEGKVGNMPSPYAYSSSTTWDSWSNKTKQTEWDSVSNKTRRYEYDPISNRMVQVGDDVAKAKKHAVDTPSPGSASVDEEKSSSVSSHAISNPVALKPTVPELSLSAAFSSSFRGDLGVLTADHVRASMGRGKDVSAPIEQVSPSNRTGLEAEFDARAVANDRETDQVLRSRSSAMSQSPLLSMQPFHEQSKVHVVQTAPKPLQSAIERLQTIKEPVLIEDADDSAAHESTEPVIDSNSTNIPKDWSRQTDLLQIDRIKRTSAKKPFPMLPRWIDDMNARKAAFEAKQVPSVREHAEAVKKQKLEHMLEQEVEQQKTRFATHETRRASKTLNQELERELGKYDQTSTTAPLEIVESQDSGNVDNATSDVNKALKHFDGESGTRRSAAVLETELAAQRAETNQVEERYKNKVRSLQAELDTAYKQSSEHSEMHLDHIRKLERALGRFEGSASSKRVDGTLAAEVLDTRTTLEQKYKQKLQTLQAELDTAYKQSSKHSEMHMDQIRNLERELEKVNKATRGQTSSINKHTLESVRGEGDFCTNVVKFANSEKWYKRPAQSLQLQQEAKELEQKAQDQRLVQEVRNIYERAYGTIDTQHRQHALDKALATESSVQDERDGDVVSEALSSYEHKQAYGFEEDSLARDLGKEKQIDEVPSQQYCYRADGLAGDLKQQQKRIVDPDLPQYRFQADGLANEIARQEQEAHEATAAIEQQATSDGKHSASSSVETQSPDEAPRVEWEDPPTYKVLTYDTAKDTFSTTTTTSNFTSDEEPISLARALSLIHQPARFMSHFAELQRDGFQVIYATRDLLLFKQVKSRPALSPGGYVAQQIEHLNVHDHGLLLPYENILGQEAAMYHHSSKAEPPSDDPSSVEHGHTFGLTPPENMMAQEAARAYDLARRNTANPIDGTMSSHGTKPATGNFANPTDFVNHDPVTLPNKETGASQIDGEAIQYPKVKRQEPVFSATLPPPPVPRFGRSSESDSSAMHSRLSRKELRRHLRVEQLERRRERQKRRRSGAGTITWVLSVGIVAAGTAYVIGTVAEKTRTGNGQNGQNKERWQEILEGKRGRWD